MSLKTRKISPVTGVILAGGKSRRMGENKALLQLGGDSLIGHVIHRMRLVTDELLLITNSPAEYTHLDLPIYGDIVPNTGALGGIYTGLTYASHDPVLCVACDSPFLEPKLLTYLAAALGEYDATMPYTTRRGKTHLTFQTLCAAYAKSCLAIIERMLQDAELRVHALQEWADIKRIPPEIWQRLDPKGMSFFNINTQGDFANATAYMRSQTQQ